MSDGFPEDDDYVLPSASTLAAFMPQPNYEMMKVYQMLRYLAALDRSDVRNADRILAAVDKGEIFGAAKRVYDNRFGPENEDGLTPAALGTHVHGILEDIMTEGRVDERKLSKNPHDTTKDHVRQLIDWFEVCKPTAIRVEQFVYNWELGYGGTADLIADINIKGIRRRKVLIDLKTTSKAPIAFYTNKYAIQLCTYWSSSHMWTIKDNTRTDATLGRAYLIKEEQHEQNKILPVLHDHAIILTVWPEGWQMREIYMPPVMAYMPAAVASYWFNRNTMNIPNEFVSRGTLMKGSADV